MADLPAFDTAQAFKFTQSPNPNWKIGDGLSLNGGLSAKWKSDEDIGFKTIDPGSKSDIYKLMISAIVPRPIAFVSSLSVDGVPNLAPFSYFAMANHNPPIISVSVNCKGSTAKDTAKNIMDTKTFTVNILSEPFIEAANWTSTDAPEEVDEWVGSGLTKEPSSTVKPPRVKESAFSMECELYQTVPLSHPNTPDKPTGYLILGLVKLFHVRKAVLNENGTVDPHKYHAIARMGDITYGRLGDGFRIPRPQWNDVKDQYEQLQVLDGKNPGDARP